MQYLLFEKSTASKIQFKQLSYSENAKKNIPRSKIKRWWLLVKLISVAVDGKIIKRIM